MQVSALTPDQARELAALRRRAYGPDADIDADPTAWLRLEHLEHVVHDGTPTPAGETFMIRAAALDGGLPAPVASLVSAPSAPAAAPPPEESEPKVDGPVSPRWTALRDIPVWSWVVAGSALLVTLAIVWGALVVTAPRSDVSLAPIADDEPLPSWIDRQGFFIGLYDIDVDSAERFESFRTLRVWSLRGAGGARCLMIEAPQLNAAVGFECSPAGLDPTVDVPIWSGMDERIIDGMPSGSAYRFVLVGDRVHVWARSGPSPAAEP